MTPKGQKLLATILTILFLVITPIIIMYAFGYRITNLSEGFRPHISATGGIRIIPPLDYEVTLNGTNLGKAPLYRVGFDTGTIEVKLSRDGYQPWIKNLSIEPYLVTLVDSVILFPDSPSLTAINTPQQISQMVANPDSDNILFTSSEPDKAGLWLYNPETNLSNQIISTSRDLQAPIDQQFEHILWDESGQQVFFFSSVNGDARYYVASNVITTNPSLTLLNTLLAYNPNEAPLQEIALEGNSFTYLQGGHVFQIDLSRNKRSDILVSDVAKAQLIGNTLYYITEKNQEIRAYNTISKTQTTLVSNFDRPIVSWTIPDSQSHMILHTEGEEVYITSLTQPSPTFTLLPDIKATDSEFREDPKHVLLHGSNQIAILYLESIQSYQTKQEGEIDILYTSEKSLESVSFFGESEHYISFQEQDVLKIVELDTRGTPNTFSLTKAENHSIVFIGNQAVIIIQDGSSLQRFTFPYKKNLF